MSESENLQKKKAELSASVEALLFVAAEPVSPVHLATIIEITTSEIEELLDKLQETYQDRGICLQWHAGKVQLTSSPEKGELIERFLGLETSSSPFSFISNTPISLVDPNRFLTARSILNT